MPGPPIGKVADWVETRKAEKSMAQKPMPKAKTMQITQPTITTIQEKKKIVAELKKETEKLKSKVKELEKSKKEVGTKSEDISLITKIVGYSIIALIIILFFTLIYFVFFRRVPRPIQQFPQQMYQVPQQVMTGGAKKTKSFFKQLKRIFK